MPFTNLLLVLPVLIPLLTAVVCLLERNRLRSQRWIVVGGTGALLVAGVALLWTVWRDGIAAVQVGSWPAPFGITLVADLFGAMMVVLAGITGFAVAVYSLGTLDHGRERFGYYPLFNILLMGVCGAFLTGDLFNLYVWFEVMLIASFVLLVLGGERQQIEGAIKYVALNLLSSALFLAAVGLLYGTTGTLNMADLSLRLASQASPGLIPALAMLFLVAFGIKAAAFPLFFWLPASYHTPPVAVSAIFAGLLTKVGVYSLIRVFTLLFVQEPALTHKLILWLAALTMLTGVLGAVAQSEFRRILSFHIVSQIGYMILGLGLFTPLALAGSVFYIAHHIIVKTNLFLVSGAVHRRQGSFELKRLGGVYRASPALAILFLVPAFSLAGLPPLSGFFAKLSLVMAGLHKAEYAVVVLALLTGMLTLFSMTKIWGEVFWKPAPPHAEQEPSSVERVHSPYMVLPMAGLAAITVAIGFCAELVFALALRAAEQLLNPSEYIRAVLGG